MKRVNISLKDEIHSQAKIISILKKIPLGKYLESCIKRAIAEDKKILENIKSKLEK
ncbi:hypothetical protein JYT91_00830 [archaeon AH-315-M20]|nr:hypothetical protein [archaeon AH-315-M20]